MNTRPHAPIRKKHCSQSCPRHFVHTECISVRIRLIICQINVQQHVSVCVYVVFVRKRARVINLLNSSSSRTIFSNRICSSSHICSIETTHSKQTYIWTIYVCIRSMSSSHTLYLEYIVVFRTYCCIYCIYIYVSKIQ